MQKGFWENLKLPAMVLAPMADVTDAAFRRIIAKYGKPDVMWTEFVSADGLTMGGESAREHLLPDLMYSEAERPIVAQLFSAAPKNMKEAAKLVADLGFDGLDINMGCPDRSIEKQGAGAAMIKDPENAVAVIEAAKQGAPHIPVSVKTRIGYNRDELDTWLPRLLEAEPAVITVHARTRKEMSKVPARWEYVAQAVKLRDQVKSKTLVFGNGDVANLAEAKQRVAETYCDGVMIGRGIFGNPWCFNPDINRDTDVSREERLRVMVEHTQLFTELLPQKNFAIMKKHYKAYVHGWPASPQGRDGAKELRMELMECVNADQVEEKVNVYLEQVITE